MSDAQERYKQIIEGIANADREIARAFEERIRWVRALSALRKESGGVMYKLPHLEEVLRTARMALRELDGELALRTLEAVMREVVGASGLWFGPLRIALAGPDFELARVAARAAFGSLAELFLASSPAEAIRSVERNEASAALLPFETTDEGTVASTLFALVHGSVPVIGERTVPRAYHLYGCSEDGPIERITGSRFALSACARSIEERWPEALVIESRSIEHALELAQSEAKTAVLLASDEEAQGLRRIHAHLEDDPHLKVRFVVLSRDVPRRTGADRTLIALLLQEKPGSLYAALAPFAERGINISHVESRRAPGPSFEQLVFLELDGHISDRPMLAALDEVRMRSRELKVLGSYPKPTGQN